MALATALCPLWVVSGHSTFLLPPFFRFLISCNRMGQSVTFPVHVTERRSRLHFFNGLNVMRLLPNRSLVERTALSRRRSNLL